MNNKKLFFILTVAVLLVCTTCSGSFVDPNMTGLVAGGGGSGGTGGDGGPGDGGGTGGGGGGDSGGGSVTWTAVADTKFDNETISGIAWGGTAGDEKFIAVGKHDTNGWGTRGKAAYSADGVTWTAVVDTKFNETNSEIYAVAWVGPSGNQKFVAGGLYGKAAYSTDGVTWTAVGDTKFSNYDIHDIAWGGPAGNEKFVAVGGCFERGRTNSKAAYSSDGGVTWTAVTDTKFGENQINGIAWGGPAGNQKFVAVGDEGKVAYSTDGVTWTSGGSYILGKDSAGEGPSFIDIAWGGPAGNEKFVAVGSSHRAAYSADGLTWTVISDTKFSSNINDIAWGNGKFVAVGLGGKAAYSADGVTWTAVTDTKFGSEWISGIAWGGTAGNEKFVAVGEKGKAAYWNGK